jgi:hypothetical protein
VEWSASIGIAHQREKERQSREEEAGSPYRGESIGAKNTCTISSCQCHVVDVVVHVVVGVVLFLLLLLDVDGTGVTSDGNAAGDDSAV